MYRIHEHKVTSPIDNILERQGTMYLLKTKMCCLC